VDDTHGLAPRGFEAAGQGPTHRPRADAQRVPLRSGAQPVDVAEHLQSEAFEAIEVRRIVVDEPAHPPAR